MSNLKAAFKASKNEALNANEKLLAQNGEISEQKNTEKELQTKLVAMRKVAAWRVLKGREIE